MNKHVIYMAAGNSRRFGSNKLLYDYQGKPLYRHGLDMVENFCRQRKDCTLLIVSRYQEILQYAEQKKIMNVYSPDSYKGVSYTIRAALQALGSVPEEDFIVFVVADQPYLKEKTLKKLLELAEPGTETASVMYGERPGNPAMFSARLIPELLDLQGDEGGRKVIRKHSCRYAYAEEEAELYDIDTPEAVRVLAESPRYEK